jgi:hypothetical protein
MRLPVAIKDAAMNARIPSAKTAFVTPRTLHVASLKCLPAALAIAVASLSACAGTAGPAEVSKSESVVASTSPQTGVVRMRPDRSLEVTTLSSAGGGRANGVRIVPPEHRDYARILEQTGPMESGDQRPYSEPTDR